MTAFLQFVHTYAIELMAVWAACSVILSALPSPEAFAEYYELPKCPNWYKTLYAVAHFLAMNWARVIPQMRLFQADKSAAPVSPIKG